MNVLRQNKGWLVPFLLDPSGQPALAVMQLIEITQFPAGPADVCMVTLSDGEHYISAKLTAVAIATHAAQQNRSVSDIRGACINLHKYDRVTSPSNAEFQLVVDEFMHLGADGSTPFFNPSDVNLVPAVRSALKALEQEDDDMMLLMAEVVHHDEPVVRQFTLDFPVPIEDTIIPSHQREMLHSFPGWSSVGGASLSQSSQQSEYFEEGVGTQRPADAMMQAAHAFVAARNAGSQMEDYRSERPASQPLQEHSPASQKSVVNDCADDADKDIEACPVNAAPAATPGSPMVGSLDADSAVYNFVDGVEQEMDGKASESSLSLSLQRDDDPPSPVAPTPALKAVASMTDSPITPVMPIATSPIAAVTSGQHQQSSPFSRQLRSQSLSPVPAAEEGLEDVSVFLSDEELPEFQAPEPSQDSPLLKKEPNYGSTSSLPSQTDLTGRWNEDDIVRLSEAIEQSGDNWDHVAVSVGHGRTPTQCKKFFSQYASLVPHLSAAMAAFQNHAPSPKRLRMCDPDDKDEEQVDGQDQEDELYEVEAIIGERVTDDGEVLYLLKWKGWDVNDATWQEKSTFQDCEELIREFHATRKQKELEEEFALPDSPPPARKEATPDRPVAPVVHTSPAKSTVTRERDERDIPELFRRPKKRTKSKRPKAKSVDLLSSRIALDVLTNKIGVQTP